MSSNEQAPLPSELAAFISAVAAWTPGSTAEDAASLRAAAASLCSQSSSKALAERSRGVARVLSAYRGRRLPDASTLLAPGAEALAATFAPFLGDPAMIDGAWPFERPLELSDQSATDWLRLLSRASPVDERLLRLARVMFFARRREAWVPASIVLAEVALRSSTAAEFVRSEWDRCHRDRPARWRATLGEDRPKASQLAPSSERPDAHAFRHAFHLGCCFLARGGPPDLLGGATVAEFLGAGVPTGDASDASAVLTGWREFARIPQHREQVATSLRAVLPLRRSDAQCEEALRALVDELRSCREAAASVEVAQRWLLAPSRWRGMSGAEQVDGLESWLRNLTWAAAHGDADALVDEALSEAGPAERLGREAAGGTVETIDAGARASSLLAGLLKAELFETTEPELRAVQVATLVRLVRGDARVRELPWPSLLRRAGASEHECASLLGDRSSAGSTVLRTGVAGPAALARLTSDRYHSPPALVIRDEELPAEIVLALVSGGSGYLETQLAVQFERLLREAPTGAARARLLWLLLCCDPAPSLLEKLHQILRGLPGETTQLRTAVAAARSLTESPPEEATVSLRRLLETLAAVCESDSAAEPWKARLADLAPLEALGRQTDSHLPRPLDRFGALATHLAAGERLREMIDPPNAGAADARRSPLHDAWLRVEKLRTDATQSTSDHADQERLVAALTSMQAVTRETARVERLPIEQLVGTLLAEATERLVFAVRLRSLLDAGDEDAVLRALFGDASDSRVVRPNISELPASLLHRTGRFLLDQYNFVAARRLARACRQAPGPLPRLTLFAALVSGGVVQLLDVGTVWTELLERGEPARILPICLGALTLTAGMLLGEVWNQLRFVGDLRSRAWRVTRRSAVLFAGGALVSTLVNSAVLLSIDGTSLRPSSMASPFALQVALWASLSLFLGVVVARVMSLGSSAQERRD